MLEDNPLLSLNVRLWKMLAVILRRDWRVYAFVAPVCIMNAMQFVYLYRMWGDLTTFILNTFFAAAIFDALLKTCAVVARRERFEAFLMDLDDMYLEIEQSHDPYALEMLHGIVTNSRRISIFNLAASFCDIVGALLYPLFVDDRVHPFGVALPGVDMKLSPVYEIFYILQFPTPFVLTALYMPFVSLFATFAMFGKTALQILNRRLHHLCETKSGEEEKYAELISCIKYHGRISRYMKMFNSLVTHIVFVEFLLFGGIICSLLFCMNIIDSYTQIVSIIMYISTMMYVLFTYYWHANELILESIKISETLYCLTWYECGERFKRTLWLFITLTQQPLQIMVGNIYPMTLMTFQSLLNASYSYFTLLRGVYSK